MRQYWTPPVAALRSKGAVWLPPLVGEWWKQLIPVFLAQALIFSTWSGFFLSVATPVYVPIAATLIAFLGAIVATVPHRRNMPVWDLIAWDNKRSLPASGPAQRDNARVVGRAIAAIWAGNPEGARATLTELNDPSEWVSFVALYVSGLASLLQRSKPETVPLREMIQTLDEGFRPTAMIMLAALEGGDAWLDGGDWRAPFSACRIELNIKPSTWRGLLPVRNGLIALAATPLIPWAWWLWG